MADPTPIRSLEKIPAYALLAIQATRGLLMRQRPDLTGSRLDVLRANGHLVVLAEPARGVSAPAIGAFAGLQRLLTADEAALLLAHRDRAELVGFLQDAHYPVMELGLRTFLARRPDTDGYDAELLSEGATQVVLFEDSARHAGEKGNLGRPGFEVEIDPAALRVVRANFAR